MKVRILNGVLGGVGGRERHGDDEVSGRKTQQDKDQQFALPAMQKILEHGDGALPRVGAGSHLGVDRKGAQQRDEDKDRRGNGRHRSRGQ